MMRDFPPKYTAGLSRLSVSSRSRLPRPPARTKARAWRESGSFMIAAILSSLEPQRTPPKPEGRIEDHGQIVAGQKVDRKVVCKTAELLKLGPSTEVGASGAKRPFRTSAASGAGRATR